MNTLAHILREAISRGDPTECRHVLLEHGEQIVKAVEAVGALTQISTGRAAAEAAEAELRG